MWEIIRTHLGSRTETIKKIIRINNRGQPLRYDVMVPTEEVEWAFQCLKEIARVLNWGVQLHCRWGSRQHKGNHQQSPSRGSQEQTPIRHRWVNVASWNMHSIRNKQVEVARYLHASKIGVLALQETWLTDQEQPLRFAGYNVFATTAAGLDDREGKQGHNGVALCVRADLTGYEASGAVSPFVVAANMVIGSDEWTVLSVYVPPRFTSTEGVSSSSRKQALRDIEDGIRQAMRQRPDAKIAIMGDWNMKVDELQKRIGKWRFPTALAVVQCRGSPATYYSHQSWTSIDHMVMTESAMTQAQKCHVNRAMNLSDHWPLENRIRGEEPVGDQLPNESEGTVSASPNLRIDTKKLQGAKQEIRQHWRWSMMHVSAEESRETDEWVEETEMHFRELCKELNLLREPHVEKRKRKFLITKQTKVAIRRRERAYRIWFAKAAPARVGPEWDNYLKCKATVRKAIKIASDKSWLHRAIKGSKILTQRDSRGFWRWMNDTCHQGRRGNLDYGPLLYPHDTQRMAYQPKEKLRVWKQHYNGLAADVTGHSRDVQYWSERFPGEPAQSLIELNGRVSSREVNGALKKLKPGKSAGPAGIPAEFFKLAIDRMKPEQPFWDFDSRMGQALTAIINRLFQNGIPKQWNEAWVISIHKSGDPRDVNNYRGISLIDVLVKLTTRIVTNRLTSSLEASHFFIKAQAGFRSREECAAHSCALYEILRRREIMNKKSYVAFIDIRKAYDTVPVELMLRKLALLGVSGRCLAYFRSLYSDATARVKTKYGLSDLIQLLRGLRQGCPASPLLFDIFINDILADCDALGVTLVGLDRNGRIVGLLYADDLVLICNTTRSLQKALDKIQAWGQLHEMTFGVSKCGLMGFGENAMEKLKSKVWMLDGHAIPIVPEYRHLGIPVSHDLSLHRVAKDRAKKGRKALYGVLPLVRCPQIPIWIRIMAVKGKVVSVLAFGGELWGMNELRNREPQQVLDDSLRAIARLNFNSTLTSSAALGLEYGIPPIGATVAAARTRAARKFPTLQTAIADLIESPPGTRKRTWVSENDRWLRQHGVAAINILDPREAAKAVKADVWARYNKATNRQSSNFFTLHRMEETNHFLRYATCNPTIAKGIELLSSFRVSVVRGARHLAQTGRISPDFLTRCPCCDQAVGENQYHILLKCDRWAIPRSNFLGSTIDLFEPRWFELLGGKKPQEGGIPTHEADQLYQVDHKWCPKKPRSVRADLLVSGQVDIDRQYQRAMEVPTSVLVALFLQEIMPVREEIIERLLDAHATQDPAVESTVESRGVANGDPKRRRTVKSDGRKRKKYKKRPPLRKRRKSIVEDGN